VSEPWVYCPKCHHTSFNPHDVYHRYCGFCHKFLDEEADAPETTGRRPGEYETPGSLCPACAHPFDIAVTKSGRPPERGTLSVCMKCGEAAVFTDAVHVQPLTPEDLERLAAAQPALHSTLVEMQRLVRR
jgi:hypothetical protein